VVECQLPKLDVAGSTPVARSTISALPQREFVAVAVLENMMPRLAGATLASRSLSPPRGGAAHLEMAGSRASRNFDSPNSRSLNSIKGASYTSSLQSDGTYFADWAERMLEKARTRAPD
jgi:hypothetical protein